MSPRLLVPLLAAALVSSAATAQTIIAQNSGIANPTTIIDFGANLYTNFTPITNQFAGITVSHASYFTTGVSNNLVGGFLTNDFSGPPNTLSIVFASPVTDLSFVYHQINTSAPSTIRTLLNGVPVASFSGTWNQSQPNNYFGFTNTSCDELQIDFVGDFNVDTLAIRDQGAACLFHNGSGINPADFTCATLPVLGTTWQGLVASTPNTVLTFLGYAPAGLAVPQPLLGGELLLQSSPPPVALASLGNYALTIPSSVTWIGTALVFQGFRVEVSSGVTSFVPLNANELVIGL